ncbi:hypothetical protein D3C85_1188170 [compost metagenome]
MSVQRAGFRVFGAPSRPYVSVRASTLAVSNSCIKDAIHVPEPADGTAVPCYPASNAVGNLKLCRNAVHSRHGVNARLDKSLSADYRNTGVFQSGHPDSTLAAAVRCFAPDVYRLEVGVPNSIRRIEEVDVDPVVALGGCLGVACRDIAELKVGAAHNFERGIIGRAQAPAAIDIGHGRVKQPRRIRSGCVAYPAPIPTNYLTPISGLKNKSVCINLE